MAETQFWVGVHGVLAQGGRVLVLRRSRLMTYKPGHWDLPGGHLALGENLEQCLVREIEEETGIRAEVERLLGLHKTPSQPYVQAIYGCRLGAEAPRVRLRPEEHSEWRWATPEELRGTPDLVPYLEAIVRNGMLHFLER